MVYIGDMRTNMATDKLNRLDLDTSIYYRAINRAVRYYSKMRFWFNVDSISLTLAENSNVLPINSIIDFGQETVEDGITLYYNKETYPLKKIKKHELDKMNSEATGIPQFYYEDNGNYKIYPFADRAYTLYVNYLKKYPNMTTYLDTNDFLNYAEDLIEQRALHYIWGEVEHETEMALYHGQIAENELRRLLDFSRQKISTGILYNEDEGII